MGIGLSRSGSIANIGGGNPSGSTTSIPQVGYQIYSSGNQTLGTIATPQSVYNIKNPNGLPMSDMNVQLTVVDTSGNTTAPATPKSIETVIQQLNITGTSNRLLCSMSGIYGETTRWQHVFNDNGIYITTSAPTINTTATPVTTTWNITFKHWVVDASEFPLSIQTIFNTEASRATTTNGMSSTALLTITADFVPVTGYVRTLLRTKQIGVAGTGNFDFGQVLDEEMLNGIALDVGTDSVLNASNTMYLAVNNNSLIPYTSYQSFINSENSTNGTTADRIHINGFFVYGVLYKAAVNGQAAVKMTVNFSSTPTGAGGLANTANLYMVETY